MLGESLRIIRPFALAAGVSIYALSAHATVIITGTVFPNLTTSPTGNGQINVGFNGFNGGVEVNADITGNGHTEISGTGLLIGNSATGEVLIIGDGTSGSAKAVINNGIGARVGFGGDGTLELRQGGVLESNENIHLGEESLSGNEGVTNVVVDGSGSILRSTAKPVGFGGGRVYVPFDSADSNLTVSNGGLVQAVGGDITQFQDGSVYIGDMANDKPSNVTVNVTGEGSAIEGQHGVYFGHQYGQAVVNITDGGQIRQIDDSFVINGEPVEGMAIDSFEADGMRVTVSGKSAGGVASSLSAVSDMVIGQERAIVGYTSGGEARMRYDDNVNVGDQITDLQGNPLFHPNGDPILAVEVDFGGFTIIMPENSSSAGGEPPFVKTTGHLVVENGGEAVTQGDIHISTNNADATVTPYSGADSSLTVRDGGVVMADNIYINEHGLLSGGDGLIVADVHLDGGTIAPGNSPGEMTIDGDLFLNSGLLEIEVTQAMQDVISATGSVFLGEELLISLIFDYDPMGEVFDLTDFFDTPNLSSNFNPDNLSFVGLGRGAYFSILAFGGEEIQFGQPGTPTVPAPISLVLFATGLAGLGWARRRGGSA